MRLTDYREKVDALLADQRLLARQQELEQTRLEELKQDADSLDKARAVIQAAALQTQETLRVRLTAIVTTALRSVFVDKDIEFKITFESKRGRTEAILEVGEGGVFAHPMDCRGGGVVDIVSFALRASFWAISKTRPVLISDEPFKFLSPGFLPAAADMLRMVSERLGLQIIMVTHIQEFVEIADNVITVERRNNESCARGT